jgi:hypothetical protein
MKTMAHFAIGTLILKTPDPVENSRRFYSTNSPRKHEVVQDVDNQTAELLYLYNPTFNWLSTMAILVLNLWLYIFRRKIPDVRRYVFFP